MATQTELTSLKPKLAEPKLPLPGDAPGKKVPPKTLAVMQLDEPATLTPAAAAQRAAEAAAASPREIQPRDPSPGRKKHSHHQHKRRSSSKNALEGDGAGNGHAPAARSAAHSAPPTGLF